MAVTNGSRFGLTRWGASTDPFRRAQLDADHAKLEAMGALYLHGLFNDRPAAGVEGRFYWATDTGALSYDTGAAWTAGVVLGNDSRLSDARTPTAHNHNAADTTAGVFAPARLGGGAANSGTFLRGDGQWAALASSLSALSDVQLAAPAAGHFLRHNGTKWVNAALAVGDLPVAPSGTSSTTQVVRADDSRLSDPRTPTAHGHPATDITGTKTAAFISDFTEAAQDAVAALLAAGTGVSLSYNDTGNTLTVTGLGDPETMRDTLGAALVGVGNVTVSVNDAADSITISTTATVNSTDAQLRDRATHTGTVGTSDSDVVKNRSVPLEIDTRSLTHTYAAGLLTQTVEKDGAATVKTITYNYTGTVLTSVVEAAGGSTVTTTLTYTGADLTGSTRSVA